MGHPTDYADITQMAPDVYLVSVPIPSPLRQVNCYLVRGSAGWTIIDTGFNIPSTKTTWEAAFRALDLKPRQVERIIATHHHPDHYGAAGWLQELTEAPVLMHPIEANLVENIWNYGNFITDLMGFCAENGVPREKRELMVPIAMEVMEQVLPAPEITLVATDSVIPVGDRRCQALLAPGHSEGLLLLWDAADGLLFANDMILDPITPNISRDPFTGPDPLAAYLQSLEKVARMPARLTLTGHRRPVHDLAQRCAQLQAHHRERLDFCLDTVAQLAARPPANENPAGLTDGWTVTHRLFGSVMDDEEASMFALGETTAHLDYLAHREQLRKVQINGKIFYGPGDDLRQS